MVYLLGQDISSITWKSLTGLNFTSLCQDFLRKDIAIVQVQMESQTFVKLRQSLRVNIGDKFGSIGGTLGLFCGFSTLAGFEVIHWIVKAFFTILYGTIFRRSHRI